jgi:undecaprenyl-diphosphatase
LQQLFDFILRLDYEAWFYINTMWHNDVLDAILPYLRNQWTWAPLYLFFLLFTTINFGRKGWMWCVFFLLTFALSDQISAHLIKPYIHRLRPCNNPYLQEFVHLIVPCGSGYSFPSSHAANHFGIAMFCSITMHRFGKWVIPTAFIWAASVAYAQVYVGVHFPLDVTCGAIIGIFVGWATGKLYNRIYGLEKQQKEEAVTSSH